MEAPEINSESNLSPANSSSDVTDESMDEEPKSELHATYSTLQTVRDAEEEMRFPAEAFVQLMTGLNKSPSWTVYPKQLSECIKVTALITRGKHRYTAAEGEMMHKLIREGLDQAFSKCLDDNNLLNWNAHTQAEILSACTALVDIAISKLHVIVENAKEEDLADLEEDMNCIMRELCLAFDPASPFNMKNAAEEVPKSVTQVEEARFAEPILDGEAVSLQQLQYADMLQPQIVQLTQHRWLAYLVNYFGSLAGFELVGKVLEQSERHSILFLDTLLTPIVKAEEFLLDGPVNELADKLQKVLSFMSKALAEDLEHFSDKGQDRMFSSASSLLEKANLLLCKCCGPAEADTAVGKVQRQFIVCLLGQSSFSKHLSAVRETNNLLMRALGLRSGDSGSSIKVNVEWMRDNDVVQQLLRANLHQKQYVDQVQKVLKNLTIEGGLQEDHLDLLWNLTEKVDTFETVKNNVYDMLGDLAQDFNNQQLDALFSKFETCSGKPLPDAMKIMDLMRRLAKSDTKGVMAARVMRLLWSMMMDPEAPAEVSRSAAITDALQAYASRKGIVDFQIAQEYMRQCMEQIKAGTSVPAALNLLQRLGSACVEMGTVDPLSSLEAKYGLIDVVVTSLERYLAAQQALLQPGTPQSSLSCWEGHSEMLQEYAKFLIHVPHYGGIQVTWEQVERLWKRLVDSPVNVSDRILGLHLLTLQLQKRAFGPETAAKLLTEKLTSVDASALSRNEAPYFWSLFSSSFELVAMAEGKTQAAAAQPEGSPLPAVMASLDITGLPMLWRIVLDTDETSGVVQRAQQTLVTVYTNLNEELQQDARNVRSQFVRKCLEELLPAAELLTGRLSGEVSWREHSPAPVALVTREQLLACRRAARCTSLLQDFLASCQGRTMPAAVRHAASFQGSPVRLDVQISTSPQQPRFRICSHCNSYVGQLRASVAAKLTAQPAHIRLFALGRELVNDARLLREENFQDGMTVMAVNAPNPNSYTVLPPKKAAWLEAASPTTILAHSPEIYDVLLCLADFCSDPVVQQNALRLLEVLPTDSGLVAHLAAIFAAADPCLQLRRLLLGSAAAPKPARLLYSLQALNARLFPVSEDPGPRPPLPRVFLNSGCLSPLLEAIKAVNKAQAKDVNTVRSLHSAAQLLFARLQLTHTKAATSDSSMTEAASSTLQQMSTQEAQQSPDAPIESLEPPGVATPTAAVTVTLDGPLDAEKTVDASVWKELLLFYLHLGIRSGNSWGSTSHSFFVLDGYLPNQDALIHQDAMTSLKQLLDKQPQLLDVLFVSSEHSEAFSTLMKEGLLNAGHEIVRTSTKRFGEKLAKSGGGQGYLHLLGLLQPLTAADAFPRHCGEYYRLMVEIVRMMPSMPPQARPQPPRPWHGRPKIPAARRAAGAQVRAEAAKVAEELLAEVVSASGAMTATDEEDARLEGKLTVLLELVRVLDRRNVGLPSHGHLVYRLITDFLFPESWFLFTLRETKQQLLNTSLEEVAQALQARCIPKSCRLAALNLLHDLMTHNSRNMVEGMELIRQIHLSCDILGDDVLDYSPKVQARKAKSFVGLKNAGATCYMNSVFQQLFMQPSIRRLILSCQEVAPAERADSVFYQLQSIFANLALSNKEMFRPHGFWKAFKDYDGEMLNVREHQDAYEFFTRLQDLVDQHLRDRKEKPVMQLVMGGKFAQQIICKNVAFRSEKEEDFYQVSLDVRGKRNLEESLDFYVQGELMEGDNQYLCEELGKKVDAVKRNCIKVLPHMLVIHLKRFEYDYETMNRWKIKDRFEFPEELNMYKYTVRGLEESESKDGESGGEPPWGGPSPAASLQYQYRLKGIVVHSGTAFAGHYYSYIKVRAEPRQAPEKAGAWFRFDDNCVEPWDLNNLDIDCFGGRYTLDDPALPGAHKEYDRPNSAYMLFYERADGLEPAAVVDEMAAAAKKPTLQDKVAAQARSGELVGDLEAGSSGQQLPTVPLPAIAVSVPSIYEAILGDNLKLSQELRLLDRDYFGFLLRLVKDGSEGVLLPPSTMRRTERSPSSSPAASASPEHQATARRDVDSDQAAERLINFAGQFLFRVYLRSSTLLREDLEAWGQVVSSLLDSTPAANRWFLFLCFLDSRSFSALSAPQITAPNEDLLECFLVWCENEEVSKLVGGLVSQALKNAVERDGGAVGRRQLGPSAAGLEPWSAAWAVYHTVHQLAAIWKRNDGLLPKCAPFHFCHVLLEYAALGPLPREHLHSLAMLRTLLRAVHHADDRATAPEFALLMETVSLLARSSSFNGCLRVEAAARNPYALPDPHLEKGGGEEFGLLTRGGPADFLFWPHFLASERLRALLEFVLWRNQTFSLEWLKHFPPTVRKMPLEHLHHCSGTLARLVATDDQWRSERVQMVLAERANGSSKENGLLAQAADLGNNMLPARRFAMIKLIVQLVQGTLAAFAALQGSGSWVTLTDWLEAQDAQKTPVAGLPHFPTVVSILQDLVIGPTDDSPANEEAEVVDDEEDDEEHSPR